MMINNCFEPFMLDFSSFYVIFSVVVIITALTAIIISILALQRTKHLHTTVTHLCGGKEGSALEEIIIQTNDKMQEFDTEIQELFRISNTIHKQAHKNIHKIGLVRFNPFRDYSGNQSFALALLNTNSDGIILSSIHTREGTRIFTKEIQKGLPVNNELTQEEKDAIINAT